MAQFICPSHDWKHFVTSLFSIWTDGFGVCRPKSFKMFFTKYYTLPISSSWMLWQSSVIQVITSEDVWNADRCKVFLLSSQIRFMYKYVKIKHITLEFPFADKGQNYLAGILFVVQCFVCHTLLETVDEVPEEKLRHFFWRTSDGFLHAWLLSFQICTTDRNQFYTCLNPCKTSAVSKYPNKNWFMFSLE